MQAQGKPEGSGPSNCRPVPKWEVKFCFLMKRNSKHKPVSLHVNPTTVSRPCVSETCAGFLSLGVADRSFRMWHGGRQQELWGQMAWPLNLQPSAPACFPYHSASQRMGPLRTVPGKNSVPRERQTSLLSGVIQDKSPSGATASPLFQTHGQFPSLLPQEGPGGSRHQALHPCLGTPLPSL